MTSSSHPPTPAGPVDVGQVYRTYSGDVHRFALFLTGQPALAEDLVSETFARLWHARERVDLTTVKAYLFTITRNLYLEELRSARGRIERGAQRPEQAAVEVADPAPSPARVAMARRELEDTLSDLQVLSESDRAALLLRADDLSYEEIAAALGIAPGAARVRVHRARLKLAQERDRRLEEANGGRLGIPMKEARR